MDNHTYNKLDDILQAEYKRGYEKGYAARKEADQGDNADYYKQGLEEAWECCRKLILTEENGGIPFSDFAEIFGKAESVENIVRQYTVQEVIQEIKNYEAEQKLKDEEEEIKVGDEVKYRSIINTEICGIVTGHDKNYLYFFVLAKNGEFGTVAVDNVVKTGRTFPQIAEVFEQMQ